VVVVGSFACDEPVAETLAAAALLPDVRLVFTGDPQRARPRRLLRTLPPNVELAGWLRFADYVLLLRSAAVIVALTTRDHTILRGAWEAVYLGQPLVTSGWPAQRDCFTQGALFVDNDAASIARGIRHALEHAEPMRAAMGRLGDQKRRGWAEDEKTLRALLALPAGAPRRAG
jgi:hypothetical protein